jgi:hypothetical protein
MVCQHYRHKKARFQLVKAGLAGNDYLFKIAWLFWGSTCLDECPFLYFFAALALSARTLAMM